MSTGTAIAIAVAAIVIAAVALLIWGWKVQGWKLEKAGPIIGGIVAVASFALALIGVFVKRTPPKGMVEIDTTGLDDGPEDPTDPKGTAAADAVASEVKRTELRIKLATDDEIGARGASTFDPGKK